MNLPVLSSCLLLALGGGSLTGCISTSKVQSADSSVGQQLMDLDRAYRQGIVNEKEYQRLRKAIIKKNG